MGGSYKARCVVLKKTKLGETDLILTMVDAQGKQVRAVAKGARKPGNRRFGARLEPYSVVDVVLYPGRSLESITEVRCVTTNASCRQTMEASAACTMVAELLEKVTSDGEVDERSVACAIAAFEAVGNADATRGLLVACAAIMKLSAMMGIRPITRECAACGGALDEGAVFDITAGGMLCETCAPRAGSHDTAIAAWLDILIGSKFSALVELDDAPVGTLLDFSNAWLQEHLGLRLKSIPFARQLL